MKRRKPHSAKTGLEVLEDRRLLSSVSLANGVLRLQGDANQANTFYVRGASWQRVFGMVGGDGRVAYNRQVDQIVAYVGNKTDTVNVSKNVTMSVKVVLPDGSVQWLKPGTSQTFNVAAAKAQASNPPALAAPLPTSPVLPPSPMPVASGSAPQAVITITDGATLLPGQSVHVQALNSVLGSGDALNSKFQWNFGDPGSAYNALVGYNAAHAYDKAGVYSVSLTITNPDGQTSTATASVTVQSDSRTTIYVAANGNDANSGLSPDAPIQSIARVQQLLSSNLRVLFRDGDTFATAGGICVKGFQNVGIGSYGQGAKPVLMYNGPQQSASLITAQAGTEGLSVQGLTFDSIYTDPNSTAPLPDAFHLQGSNLTVRNNVFLNVSYGANLELAPTNVLIQDNTAPSLTGLRAYFVWVQGSDITILGNTVANSTGESLIRIGGADRVLIEDNTLSNVGGDVSGVSQDSAKAAIAIQKGSYAYVDNNTILSGPIGVGPLATSNSDPNGKFNYCVFDSNNVWAAVLIQPGAHHTMARNNVVHENGAGGFIINAQEPIFGWQAQDVHIVHNAVIDSSAFGGFLSINCGEAQGVVVDYNLLVAPNMITGNGTAIISVSDNNLSSFSEIKDNAWPVPQVYGWAQGGYFYVASAPGVQAGYLTPAEWAATVPDGGAHAPGAGTARS